MVPVEDTDEQREAPPPENRERAAPDGSPVVDAAQEGTQNALKSALDPVPARKAQKLAGLSARRETHELSPHDFDLNFIYQLNEAGLPLTRRDMQHQTGNQALVLTRDELETLGYLDFIHASGKRTVIWPSSLDPDDVLILYPDEVGNEERE